MSYYLHFDRQTQEGDLRRAQVLTSDELSLPEDLHGPFNNHGDAIKTAETLIQNVVEKVLERLRTEKPRNYATFPTGSQTTEE
jgi:hypothetical protein